MRLRVRFGGFGVGRLEAEATGNFDGAEQDLQRVQGAAGLKAVGVGGNSAHGVEGHRAARHLFVGLAAEIGPLDVQFERFFKGDASDFIDDSADAPGRDAAALGHGFGGVFVAQVTLCHLVEHRAVRDACDAVGGGQIRFDAGGVKGGRLAGDAVDDQFFAVLIAHQKTELGGAFIAVHQTGALVYWAR